MKKSALFLIVSAFIFSTNSLAQENRSPINPTVWGVVYDVPTTKNVQVKKDVVYLKSGSRNLGIDVYTPPDFKPGEKRPAVIFLNAIGDIPGNEVKNWEIYKSFPRLVAAHGMIGISMDADAERIQDSLRGLFNFLEKEGAAHGIDAARLGVYAASANTTQSIVYLMGDGASKGIRAAALYYGATPTPETRIRKDLPVLFILAEGDLQGAMGQASMGLWQRVAQSGAPWTLMFAANLLHAFDAFQDNDESRRIIQQTLAFWKSHLEPVPQPDWKPSAAREIVASTYGSDFQRTVDLLTKYVAQNPNDAQAYIQMGRALNLLRKYDEAAAAYENALKLSPNHPAIFAGLGQVRFAQRRYEDAAANLSKAIDAGSRNSMLYGQLGYAQLVLNKNADAINSYEKAFEMGIPPGANTRGLAFYNLSIGYFRTNQTDKGFELLNKAVDEGFVNRQTFETDTDFEAIRSDARFKRLLERMPQNTSK